MISGENLTFCAADSNMYIGRIHPLIYCSSFFFPYSTFNFRNSHPCINLHFYRISLIYAWRAETVVLKNVRMFTCQVYWKRWSSNHALTMLLKREEKVELMQKVRGKRAIEKYQPKPPTLELTRCTFKIIIGITVLIIIGNKNAFLVITQCIL